MDLILEENFLNKLNDAAIDLDADHFAAQEHEEKVYEMVESEQTIKVLLFIKVEEQQNTKWKKQLKMRLMNETDAFISQNQI